MNSLKMKLSVLLGVAQMLLGLSLRFANAFYEKSRTDLLFECVPMFVFLSLYFGYMNWMILHKWVTPVSHVEGMENEGPPSIINQLISMSMQTGGGSPFFSPYETMIMVLVGLSVPLLLFPKPMLLWYKHRRALRRAQMYISESEDDPFYRNQGNVQGDMLVENNNGGGGLGSMSSDGAAPSSQASGRAAGGGGNA